jgi:Na+/phosphate symporter
MGTIVHLDLMGGVALLLWGLHMVHSGIMRVRFRSAAPSRAGTPQPFCGLWRWIGVPGSNRMAH